MGRALTMGAAPGGAAANRPPTLAGAHDALAGLTAGECGTLELLLALPLLPADALARLDGGTSAATAAARLATLRGDRARPRRGRAPRDRVRHAPGRALAPDRSRPGGRGRPPRAGAARAGAGLRRRARRAPRRPRRPAPAAGPLRPRRAAGDGRRGFPLPPPLGTPLARRRAPAAGGLPPAGPPAPPLGRRAGRGRPPRDGPVRRLAAAAG